MVSLPFQSVSAVKARDRVCPVQHCLKRLPTDWFVIYQWVIPRKAGTVQVDDRKKVTHM